jgi:hypothetical protein
MIYTDLLFSVKCVESGLRGVNTEWQYIGFTTRILSKRFYYLKMFGCRFQ